MNINLEVSEEPGGRVRLSGRCAVTGKSYSVVVPLKGAIDYFELGRNVAEAFPDLPKPEREFLISGTSPEGWIQLFGSQRRAEPPPTAKEGGICYDGSDS